MASPFLVRPPYYRESFHQQEQRLAQEREKAVRDHTLRVIKRIADWLDIQRSLGNVFRMPDCTVEAENQCRLHGVDYSHIPAATQLITELYLEREHA